MSFEVLKEIIKFNKAQPSIEKEALDNNECPDCGWVLNVNSKGERSCPICGRKWR